MWEEIKGCGTEKRISQKFPEMLDFRIAAYLGFACLISASLAVEPLDPMKKQKPDFNPEPYFFRARRWIQEKLKARSEAA